MGATAPAVVSVSLPPGAGSYTATPLRARLTIDNVAADSLRVTSASAVPGSFFNQIKVRSGALVKTLLVQYTARPLTLRRDKPSLAFSLVSGATAEATQNATQLRVGAGNSTVSSTGTPWIAVSRGIGNAITAGVSARPSGSDSSSFVVTSPGTQVVVPASYTVTPPAGGDRTLSTALTRLDCAGPQGTSIPSQVLGLVRPSRNDAVDVSIGYAGTHGWLQYTPLANGDFEFSGIAVGLAAGAYKATVKLCGAYPGPTLTIPVRFTGGLVLPVAPPQLTLVTPTTPATVTGSMPITAGGPSPLVRTATGCEIWLNLTRSAGVLGSRLEYSVDVNQLRAIPVGCDLSRHINLSVQGSPVPPDGVGIADVRWVILPLFDPPRTSAAPQRVLPGPQGRRMVEVEPAVFATRRAR